MSTPSVRVRLTPEGVKEVVDAFKRVQGQAERSARASARGVNALSGALRGLKGLLPAIGVGAAVAGIVALGRNALKTADEIGKIAERAGSTAETVSVLNAVFADAGQGTQVLDRSLAQLTQRLGNLATGTQKQVDTFAKLGLSAKDFVGLDTVQAFDLVAKRMGLLEDSTEKTALAIDLFGESGAGIIDILNKLGREGFDAAAEAAARTGRVVSTDLASAAAAASDGLVAMQQQAQGLATQFLAGLLPSVIETMSGFDGAVTEDGVNKMREFGRETGRVLRTVIATFRTFFVAVRDIVAGLGRQIGGLGATMAALFRGNFREAGRIWKQAGEDGKRDFETFKENFKQNLAQIADEATRDAKPVGVKVQPTIDEAAAKAAAERLARINAEIAGRAAAQRAKAQADKEAKERAAAEKRAIEELFELEQQLLQLRGQGRQAQINALDQEIKKYRETFEAAGRLSAEVEQKLGNFRRASIARFDFEDAVERAQAQLEDLRVARERIEQDVELGITSQRTAQERILEIERDRLDLLRQIAAEARRAAEATGDPALIRQAEQLNVQINEVAISVAKLSDTWAEFREDAREGTTSALAQELKDVSAGAQSARDSIVDLADAIIDMLAEISARMIAEDIASMLFGSGATSGGGGGSGWIGTAASFIGGLFGGGFKDGGTVDATPGGLLSGPGTSTSDSIVARLSDGEFVTRAAAVRRPGVLPLLQAINRQGLTTAQIRSAMHSRAGRPAFAMGGLVGASSSESSPFTPGMTLEINQTIQAPTREAGRQTAQQAATAAARALASAQRRNG